MSGENDEKTEGHKLFNDKLTNVLFSLVYPSKRLKRQIAIALVTITTTIAYVLAIFHPKSSPFIWTARAILVTNTVLVFLWIVRYIKTAPLPWDPNPTGCGGRK